MIDPQGNHIVAWDISKYVNHCCHYNSLATAYGCEIAIRDILMAEDRTRPVAGALFAVNMLVATEGGGTFTFGELREDLEAAGFGEVAVARADEAMNALVVAKKSGGS